jgi:hypothetical protein
VEGTLSSDLRKNDEAVCVHTINGCEEDEKNRKFIQPDVRCNKPSAFYFKDYDQTAFFQKLISTEVGGKQLGFAMPNEIALSLSVALKANRAADALRETIKIPAEDEYLFELDDIVVVYDFLEEVQKAIVFAYKAVEAFCNSSIPDDFIYRKENNKGIVEEYAKKEIERWIQTSEKLSSILPDCLGVDKPTSEGFWSDFKNLERLRNEIIHSKPINRSEVTAELFSDRVNAYIKSAKELLEHFTSEDQYNPVFPLGFGVSKVRTISLKSADEVFEKVGAASEA